MCNNNILVYICVSDGKIEKNAMTLDLENILCGYYFIFILVMGKVWICRSSKF